MGLYEGIHDVKSCENALTENGWVRFCYTLRKNSII